MTILEKEKEPIEDLVQFHVTNFHSKTALKKAVKAGFFVYPVPIPLTDAQKKANELAKAKGENPPYNIPVEPPKMSDKLTIISGKNKEVPMWAAIVKTGILGSITEVF